MIRKSLFSALAFFALSSELWACPQCRPLVQAGVYTRDFAANLGLMIVPLALIVGVALAAHRLK